jgi:diaminopimelate epimerase
MHGCENAYIFVDVRKEPVHDPAGTAIAVSDPSRGIGADGLILLDDSSNADLRMHMYNADGSRGTMCGNGIRCIGKLMLEADADMGISLSPALPIDQLILHLRQCTYRQGTNAATAETLGAAAAALAESGTLMPDIDIAIRAIDVETDAGVKRVHGFEQGGKVDHLSVDLGSASLQLADMACLLDGETAIDRPVNIADHAFTLTCVRMGNMQVVVFVDDVASVPLAHWGPMLENAEIFPDRANVAFAQVVPPGTLRMRPWERGSGPTRACGTGACAAALAAFATNRLRARENAQRICRVDQPGGSVMVQVEDHITLTGPARTVETGDWHGPRPRE